jgi:hypothetical protein
MAAKDVEQIRAWSRAPARARSVGPSPGPSPARVQPVAPTRTRSGVAAQGPPESKEFEIMAQRMYVLAAIQIQSVFRGFWVRDCLDVDQYCATVIQNAFRRFRLQNNFHYDLYRIVVVQSVWRGNIARGSAFNKLALIIAIQSAFRGFSARWKLQRRRDRMWQADRARRATRMVAAIVIQSRWRSYVCESHFIRSLVDVLIVQTVFRRWSAKRRAAMLRKAMAKMKATRMLVKQVDDAQRIQRNQEQFRSAPRPVHGSEDTFRDVPENGLNLSYEEPGQIFSSAAQGPKKVDEDKRPAFDFKPVNVSPATIPGRRETPANESLVIAGNSVQEYNVPPAVTIPGRRETPANESLVIAGNTVQEYNVPPAVTIPVRRETPANESLVIAGNTVQEYNVPPAVTIPGRRETPANESLVIAGNKVQEYNVPPAVTIPGRRGAKFADADSGAASESIEVAGHKVQEYNVPPAVTVPVRREAKPPVVDFKPVKESSDRSLYIHKVQEYNVPPAVTIPARREEKGESADSAGDDPGDIGATNLLSMWKSRDKQNSLVIGKKR